MGPKEREVHSFSPARTSLGPFGPEGKKSSLRPSILAEDEKKQSAKRWAVKPT